MPLFVAVLIAIRHRRTETRIVPIARPPLWWLLLQEATEAARTVGERLGAARVAALVLAAAAVVLSIATGRLIPSVILAALAVGVLLTSWLRRRLSAPTGRPGKER